MSGIPFHGYLHGKNITKHLGLIYISISEQILATQYVKEEQMWWRVMRGAPSCHQFRLLNNTATYIGVHHTSKQDSLTRGCKNRAVDEVPIRSMQSWARIIFFLNSSASPHYFFFTQCRKQDCATGNVARVRVKIAFSINSKC